MSSLLQDLRFALRLIRKNPLLSFVVIFTIGLCVGTGAALFSVVKGLMISPFPYPGHEQLAWMQQAFPQRDIRRARFSLDEVEDLNNYKQVFDYVSATRVGSINLVGEGDPERLRALDFSADFFELLGVEPLLGRWPTESESRGLDDPVVVMSHRLWTRRFGADEGVLGQSLDLEGRPHAVIGVMPPRFLYGGADLWYPIERSAYDTARNERSYVPLARIREGIDMERARDELAPLAQSMEQQFGSQYPEYQGMTYNAASITEYVLGRVRPALVMLQWAVALVFLIACANIANLLLARATARGKEIAVRLAMGSGSLRVARQFLIESLVLAISGGALGFLLTLVGVKALVALIPARFVPIEAEIVVDTSVLLFALGAAVLAGILFGLAPSVFGFRKDPLPSLKEGGRGAAEGGFGQRLRKGLVVVEIALALIVLVGAGLAIQSLRQLSSVDPGFRTENLLSARIALPADEFPEDTQAIAFFDELERRAEALPGVEAAAITSRRPLRRIDVQNLVIEGRSPDEDGGDTNAVYKVVSPDFFETLGIPLRRGRYLLPSDFQGERSGAVVINEYMAGRFWKEGQDPLASRLKLGTPESDAPWLPVVGIVADVKQFGLDSDVNQEMYVPYGVRTNRDMAVMLRTSVEPTTLTASLGRIVRELRPNQPIYDVLTMEERADESLGVYRLTMALLVILGTIALVLALLGIYATIAFSVHRRTHEMGLRLALGAELQDLFRLVVGEGLKLAVIGLVLGIAGALASAKLVSSLVYGVSTTDPWTIAAVAVLLTAMAVFATVVPARRASRTDPVEALRYE